MRLAEAVENLAGRERREQGGGHRELAATRTRADDDEVGGLHGRVDQHRASPRQADGP
jgi:hypothetical protein